MNRELKRRASRSERASAAESRSTRRRSRPLRAVIACASIALMMISAILPTFASSANGDMEGVYQQMYESMASIDGLTITTETSRWNFPYNSVIVGEDPQSFQDNQKTENTIYGPSAVLQYQIIFDKIESEKLYQEHLWPNDSDDFIEGNVKERVLLLPTFTAFQKGGVAVPDLNCIVLTMRVMSGYSQAVITKMEYGVYYQEDDIRNRMTAYTNITGDSPLWVSAWTRKLNLQGRYSDLVWGTDIVGLNNYHWLTKYARVYFSGGKDALDANDTTDAYTNPFARTMRTSIEAGFLDSETVQATTRYEMRRWWQTGIGGESETNQMQITFKGKNIVCPATESPNIPYIHELPDNWAGLQPRYTTSCTYSYYYIVEDINTSYGGGYKQYIQVTKNYESDMQSAVGKNINLYPSFNELFPNSLITDEDGNPLGKANVYGLVINEFTTTLYFDDYAINDKWGLYVTDYYYRGEAKQKRLVMNFVNDRQSEFYPKSNWSSLGKFLSETVGGFFDHKLFGVFSIGDIMLVIIGIALVITFLKFFAGG